MTNREIDALIAKKVMGYEPSEFTHWPCGKARSPNQLYWRKDGKLFMFDNLPHYSTDIAAAWQVVEKIKGKYRGVEIGYRLGGWFCQIEDGTSDIDERYIAQAEADTAPLSICLAALKAVGVEPK